MTLTSEGPALSPCTTTLLSLPCINALKMAETASSPACELCGTSRPASGSEMFDIGASESAPVDATGPMLTSPKKFWNPIDESSMPTCEGCHELPQHTAKKGGVERKEGLTLETLVWSVR